MKTSDNERDHMESVFLKDGELARVRTAQPFSGKHDGPPSLDMTFQTTPGHQSGGGISQETALELAALLVLKLEELGAPMSKPCTQCGKGDDNEPKLNPQSGLLEWFCSKHIPAN